MAREPKDPAVRAFELARTLQAEKGSLAGLASYVQRKMKIGYGDAVDLVQALERSGHVTAADPDGVRHLTSAPTVIAPAHPPLPKMTRKLDRAESHDLSMIIKERTKVLETAVDHRAAECMADFEMKMAQVYRWDQDDVWEKATRDAAEAVRKAQIEIEKRCKELGIPSQFAPGLQLDWRSRGQNLAASRRRELREVAKKQVESMKQKALAQIRKQGLDLRTQVVTMSVVSPEAHMFLDSLAPVEEAMKNLDFKKVELSYLEEKSRPRPAIGYYGDD